MFFMLTYTTYSSFQKTYCEQGIACATVTRFILDIES